MKLEDVTPFAVVKNEEYWIGYGLRALFERHDRVIVADTGSTDATLEIVKDFPGAHLLRLGHCNPGQVKEAFNRALAEVDTPWGFVFAGDEFYEPRVWDTLEQLKPGIEITVVDILLRAVGYDKGRWFQRGGQGAVKFVRKGAVKWGGQPHPFERIEYQKSQFMYFQHFYGWHLRHLARSSKDDEVHMRLQKKTWWKKTANSPIDPAFFGEYRWNNPYLKKYWEGKQCTLSRDG